MKLTSLRSSFPLALREICNPLRAAILIAGAISVGIPWVAHAADQWTITGANNLGMHCMDDDYSVFSILPPFNTINAQLIDPQGHLVTNPAGITLTYEAVADPAGSFNSTSAGKTNFWDYVAPLFGVNLPVDAGLAGFNMPGLPNTPQAMTWDSGFNWFNATGIPITPVDDFRVTNTYPLLKITAKNASGQTLASARVVTPVSTEVDCRRCHASGSNDSARPEGGWVNDPDPKRDHRLNILRLHDEKNVTSTTYQAALAANHFRSTGLFDTVKLDGQPILCAACHASEALGTAGYPGSKPLTASVHGHHAEVVDPVSGLKLNDVTNREACYQCHPGSTTRCLRGAMGLAVARDGTLAMQCQSCHGTMSDVGALTRTGWLDEPNCQACHTGTATSNSGQIVYTSAFDSPGHLRVPADPTFATNPNTPAAGRSLYRFSKGHGGLQCEACHGSTHAEFPSGAKNDNLYSIGLQGHAGKLSECSACHLSVANSMEGPHGLHPLGQSWVNQHADFAEKGGTAACQSCHGSDYRGTRLSRALGSRNLSTEGFGIQRFWQGQTIGCYDCHNGPSSEDTPGPKAPTVHGGSVVARRDVPEAVTLKSSSQNLRIVTQPEHGTVAINGRRATYFPEAGYTGSDRFTFAGSNGFVESKLGVAKVRVVGTINGQPDFSPPRILRVQPKNHALVSAAEFTVTGRATDNRGVAQVEYRVGFGPWQAAIGTSAWSATIVNQPAGPVAVTLRATDIAGNRSPESQLSYTAQ
jgi:hypothetical protein